MYDQEKFDPILRRTFKKLNPLMLGLWRLGLGKALNAAPDSGGQIMVLVHTGRKSGIRYRTPVNYALIDGDIYVTAGFGRIADWYQNIKADPRVEVWLPEGWWEGVAEDVSDAPERIPWMRQVLIASGFAALAAGIDPKTMGDAALDAATREYRVLRIRRTAARTGAGGPGDLAWVWPLSTLFLLLILWLRPSRR
jgi:deazaflavin-dependent oxidoreductase (nitroreductase family)